MIVAFNVQLDALRRRSLQPITQLSQRRSRDSKSGVVQLPSSPFLPLLPFSRGPPPDGAGYEIWESTERGRQTVSVHCELKIGLKISEQFKSSLNDDIASFEKQQNDLSAV